MSRGNSIPLAPQQQQLCFSLLASSASPCLLPEVSAPAVYTVPEPPPPGFAQMIAPSQLPKSGKTEEFFFFFFYKINKNIQINSIYFLKTSIVHVVFILMECNEC